ncbi:gluzincin family metallopeptidase [Aneurinibacillus sp. REN35]|uniref:hypothetical protein n=1 Tax=Aneurinibacillus sp. REN35 TaxID=3237286 RepID=UPI003529D04B
MKAVGKLGLLSLLLLLLLSGFFTINKNENPRAVLAGIVHDIQESEWVSSVLAEDKLDVLSENSARGDAHRQAQQTLERWAKVVGSQNTQQMHQLMHNTNEKDMAQWLAMAPIEEVKVQLTGAGHLMPGASGSSLSGLQAEVKYRYAGGKQNEWYRMKRSFDMKQTKTGAWIITQYTQVDQPAFFELNETKMKQTDHFFFLYHEQSEDEMPSIMKQTEQAYQEMGQRLAIQGTPPYPVLVYPEEGLWQGGHTVATASGQYYLNAAGYKVTNQFISLNLEALQRSPQDESVYTTLKHEIVHLYQFPQLPPYVPVWLMEGMAMYYSEDDMSYVFRGEEGERRLGEINLAKLTSSERLGDSGYGVSGRKQQQEYAFSYDTVRYLAEVYGEEKLLALVKSYSDTPWFKIKDDIPADDEQTRYKWERITSRLTNEYLQKHYGLTEKELEERVKVWINEKNTN